MKPTVFGNRNELGATPAPLQDKDGAARVYLLFYYIFFYFLLFHFYLFYLLFN